MSATHKRILLATWIVGGLTMGTIEAALTVTNPDDSGPGSLRQTIADAAPGDTIVFDASLNGGVITLTSGELSFSKSLIIQGPGPDSLAIDGNGASRVFLISPTNSHIHVTMSGLCVTNGTAESGGAILGDTSSSTQRIYLTMSNCLVVANQATGASGTYVGGGGIAAARNTFLTMVDCEIVNNQANAEGGGAWVYSQARFERCAFVGNQSTQMSAGGLLIRDAGPVEIIGCTFSGNIANFTGWQDDYGGGAIMTREKALVTIYNSTFSENTTNKRTGGILSRGTVSMVLHSTLISGNIDGNGYPDVSGTFSAVTNCLVTVTNAVALPGANNIFGQDARLDVLADNGGLTRTHALLKNSPAIDAGYNPLALTTDQRGPGFPRLLGLAVDIGAYEFLPPPPATLICIR